VLFLPYSARQAAALRYLIATRLTSAIIETMSGGGDRHLWFIIDELDALGQIDGLKDALARLRKFGGRCALGFQTIAQVRGTYSDAEAQTIVENCGDALILPCSASERGGTAVFASRRLASVSSSGRRCRRVDLCASAVRSIAPRRGAISTSRRMQTMSAHAPFLRSRCQFPHGASQGTPRTRRFGHAVSRWSR